MLLTQHLSVAIHHSLLQLPRPLQIALILKCRSEIT
jgi:hypothetical protein